MASTQYANGGSSIYIDGSFRKAQKGGEFEVENPATEEVICRVASGDASDVDLAVQAARKAFDHGPWGRSSGAERAAYLRKLADAIEAEAPRLAALETLDNGKPRAESDGDIGDTVGTFRYYAGLAEGLDSSAEQTVAVPDERFKSHVQREPIGVVGAIIPWNYPLLMLAWKVAPALAAGCTMVLKPSELTPLTSIEFAALCGQVGLPAGVFNLVTGLGASAGEPLARHPLVDKLAFTGSVPTGQRVMTAASETVKVVTLELGGKSPILVFDDADIEQVVEWVMIGIFFNQGQVCSATSRLLIQRGIADRVLTRLVAEVEKLKIGDGRADGTRLGPVISKGQYDKILAYLAAGKAAGAKLLTGGARAPGFAKGHFVQPTIFADVPTSASIWTEEIFGPVLAVRTFDTEDEAVLLANDTTYGLGGAVLSKDAERCRRVVRRLRCGIVWVNCSQPTFCQAPWGGMKRSGIGRELGPWGLDNYLEVKQVTEYASSDPYGWYLSSSL